MTADSSDGLAGYSNFGRSTVDLGAPGSFPPMPQPTNSYTSSFVGSSFAAPHVTGAAGLLAAVKPDATAWEIRAALMQSVDRRPSLINKVVTHGRLNVGRAVEVLTNDSLPPIVVAVTPTSSRTRQSQRLEVWFSQPMDRASVEAAWVIQPPVPGTFQWSDDSRSFQLVRSDPFTWTNHTARIRGTAMSMAGRTLDGNYNRIPEGAGPDDYVWTFDFAPSNDNFENAQVIVGQAGSVTGNTYNASWQLDESHEAEGFFKNAQYPGNLWYRWTATEDTWLTFEAAAPTLDTALDVQTGDDVTTLHMIAANDDYGPSLSGRVSFAAKAGTNYAIAVMSSHPTDFSQAMGSFSLRWYPTPAPSLIGVGVAPTSGYSGQPVTFNGTNLTGATRVLFNGASAPFTNALANNADLRITAVIPHEATTGPITVETPHGNVTTTSNFTVLLRPIIGIRNLPGTNRVELSWPIVGGFSLQRADSLNSAAIWTTTAGASAGLTNGIRYVTVTNDMPNRFFRLYRP